MNLLRVPKATLVVAAAACFALSGCLVSAPPPARPIAIVDEPMYHDGYTVRYDTYAPPYYHQTRAPRYSPRAYPRYDDGVRRRPRHYRTY